MGNRGTFTKLLAVAGTALVWFPLLATGLLAVGRLGAGRMLHVDYLTPDELFPAVLAGGGLLLWAAWRARSRRRVIGWGLAAAAGALVAAMVIAAASGLASGEREAAGVWWALTLALLVVYTLAIPAIGAAGILLLRDLFAGRSREIGIPLIIVVVLLLSPPAFSQAAIASLPAATTTIPVRAQAPLAPMAFDCGAVTEIPPIECEALVALNYSTDGAGWTNQTGWLTTNTPCSWYGVTCGTGHVIELSLNSNRLSGILPPELGNLDSLQRLSLFENQLSGGIPSELGGLAALEYLDLGRNPLRGSIPAELGSLANLQGLWLISNQLSGSIPPELGSLGNLRFLDLELNQLEGGIPPEMGRLANLQVLDLASNQLSGSIPAELGELASLQALDLASNQLHGPLPQSLTSLSVLSYFYYDTGLLCAPANAAFQAWLAAIPYKPSDGATCKTCYLPVMMR